MAFEDGPGDRRVEPRFESINDPGEGTHSEIDQPKANLRGKLLGALVALAAVAGFVGIAWYATTEGRKDSSVVVPMIRADNSPIKVLPEKPGGMEVPNQDKLIFMQITPGQKKPKTESLLPPPEKPMAKPAPPPTPKTPPSEPASPQLAKAPPSEPAPPKTEELVTDAVSPPARAPLRPDPVPTETKAPPEALAEPKGPAGAEDQSKTPANESKPTEPTPKPAAESVKPVKEVPEVTEVARAAAPDAAAGAATAKGGYLVQLGAIRTEDGAMKEAGRLNKRYQSLLSGLTVKAVRADLGARGIFYRLRAGPLTDRAAAADICAKLKARKQGCMVINP